MKTLWSVLRWPVAIVTAGFLILLAWVAVAGLWGLAHHPTRISTAGFWVLVIFLGGVAVAVAAALSRRDGESFDHATDRILNNDAHKAREANKRAGLG